MAVLNKHSGTSQRHEHYLDGISADKVTPQTELPKMEADRNVHRTRNQKRTDRHRCLVDNLPIQNLNDALATVEQ